jgi:tRNA pseudouridine32 synthase/23S rRNA pseudouridine746 synthase
VVDSNGVWYLIKRDWNSKITWKEFMSERTFKIKIGPGSREPIADILCRASNLSRVKIKDAMAKGAVWVIQNRRQKRVRRASSLTEPGSTVAFYYDPTVLDLAPEKGKLISDEKRYSVWFKPGGVMSQGTLYGDHGSILRQVEIFFERKRPVFPVNRLDRETAGLILLAHSKKAAAELSMLFQERKIKKNYMALVKGHPGHMDEVGVIAFPLDGKSAVTRYKTLRYDPLTDEALVEVSIETGRLHQIRRHFHMIGCPVWGDPRYGKGNKNREGLRLAAISLEFTCPLTGEVRYYHEPAAPFFNTP